MVLEPLVPVKCILYHLFCYGITSIICGILVQWEQLRFVVVISGLWLYLLSPWSSSTHATIFPSQPGTTAPSWNT